MIKIELRGVHSGKALLFDDDMAEVALGYKWAGHRSARPLTTYARTIGPDGRPLFAHHLVIGQPPKGYVTDHINGDGLDNRRRNLRHITQSDNMKAAYDRLGDEYQVSRIRGGLRTTIKYLADGTPKTYFYDRKTGRAVPAEEALQRFGDEIPEKTLAGIRTAIEPNRQTD